MGETLHPHFSMGRMTLQAPDRQGSSHSAAVLAGVFLATVAFQLPFFDLWFSFMDEGHMVQFSDIARGGGEFYRDATFYPLPGAFYFLALIFKLFEHF